MKTFASMNESKFTRDLLVTVTASHAKTIKKPKISKAKSSNAFRISIKRSRSIISRNISTRRDASISDCELERGVQPVHDEDIEIVPTAT